MREAVTFILIALAARALDELFDWGSVLARKIVSMSALLLPAMQRGRYEEEWLADLDALPGGGLSQLVWSARIVLSIRRLRSELNRRAAIRRVSFAQRVGDIVAGGFLVAVLSPLLLAMFACSRGKLGARSKRLGEDFSEFTAFGATPSMPRDKSPTGLLGHAGWLFRLFNVISGSLTLVSDRTSIRPFPNDAPEIRRCTSRPGLICHQVIDEYVTANGLGGTVPIPEKPDGPWASWAWRAKYLFRQGKLETHSTKSNFAASTFAVVVATTVIAAFCALAVGSAEVGVIVGVLLLVANISVFAASVRLWLLAVLELGFSEGFRKGTIDAMQEEATKLDSVLADLSMIAAAVRDRDIRQHLEHRIEEFERSMLPER